VILYTCGQKTKGASLPGPLAHPCGKAAKALDEAGHEYEIKTVAGGVMMPWTWPSRGSDRAEVEELSGQRGVPILVLDGGEVVNGSGEIVDWARKNPPAPAVPPRASGSG
jgi:glutathione S-transferase